MLQKLKRTLERNLLGRDPYYHDPYEDPAEQFYARIYLKRLFQAIDAEFRRPPVKILDLGCHTGRLSVPLAKAGHAVTAIDTSRFHIKLAVQHAREEGVSLRFLKGDGFHHLRRFPNGSFDFVLCTEVLYQLPDFRERLHDLAEKVRPGGLLATSHRTRFYYLLQALARKDHETARLIQARSEGALWGSYFNWQMPEELKRIYAGLGFDLVTLCPIGVFTGNGEDAMTHFADLGGATERERESLFGIETGETEEFAALGRYLLAIGRKREG